MELYFSVLVAVNFPDELSGGLLRSGGTTCRRGEDQRSGRVEKLGVIPRGSTNLRDVGVGESETGHGCGKVPLGDFSIVVLVDLVELALHRNHGSASGARRSALGSKKRRQEGFWRSKTNLEILQLGGGEDRSRKKDILDG